MYRHFLRGLSAICLLYAFWPTFRFQGLTIFDWLVPITILCALPYTPKDRGAPFGSFTLATCGIAFLALAGIISVGRSSDSYEHIMEVLVLVVALSGIVGLAFVLENRKILTVGEALVLLCLSAAACSAVVILQGQYRVLMYLIPKDEAGGSIIPAWGRMTGLAQHPIEAGIVAAYGVVIALGLCLYTRKWPVFLVAVAIGVYSYQYSASLTALAGVLFASAVMCLHARAYKTFVCGIIIGICGLWIALSTNSGQLGSRLASLSQNQGNYATLRSRELQWDRSLEMIEPSTLLVGNGYSTLDLPYNMDIHDGLIAAIYHFGLLGLISQVLLIAFFVVRLWHDASPKLKTILLGCLIIFAFSYLTGPALSRRSLWVPPLILGAYLTTVRQTASSRVKPVAGTSSLGAKRELPGEV